MPWLLQSRLYRQDLQANPNVLYLFGDNHLRVGLGGQAGEMRNEPNAIGVRTKIAPSMQPSAFLSDRFLERTHSWFVEDLARVKDAIATTVCVLPLDGLGTGLADLPLRAPKTYQLLQGMLHSMGAPVRVPHI